MIKDEAAQAMSALNFSNRLTQVFSADPQIGGPSRTVTGALYSRVLPTPVASPRLLAWTPEVAALVDPHGGLQAAVESDPDGMAAVLAGNVVVPGMDPHATRYGGHQFGQWAGQLGDGRAINLGEVATPQSEHWTLQIKGAGVTPYSRFGDGRAVLRSSLREYLCSEAMHHLGVPTTRALSLVLSGETVVRDMFYDGRPAPEPGAIVCRVAESFIRFGHFEILAAQEEYELLEQLLEFVIRSHWPALAAGLDKDASLEARRGVYLEWYRDVCDASLQMVTQWQRVGFVHGVLNTDNMSVLGQTIDYGPYGWLDDYDPDWTPNTTDAHQRRYRFSRQPATVQWNLYQLARSLTPLFDDVDGLQQILTELPEKYAHLERRMMADKLGIHPDSDDLPELSETLEKLLQHQALDYTLFFRGLMEFQPANSSSSVKECVAAAMYTSGERLLEETGLYHEFEELYRRALLQEGDDALRQRRMASANPVFVLRNYIAQEVIDDLDAGSHALFEEVLRLLRHPYERLQTVRPEWYGRRPDWARNRPGCSMLSCSS